jgi:hypothetical protein
MKIYATQLLALSLLLALYGCFSYAFNVEYLPIFSAEKSLTELCSKSFKCIGNSCWAGGTTGQWFGLK